MFAAPGGWLELLEGVECLEDSFTAPEYRGRGLAPKVWRVVQERRRADGARTLVTKVAVENVASCRGLGNAGFKEFAVVEAARYGPRWRVRVHAAPKGLGRP